MKKQMTALFLVLIIVVGATTPCANAVAVSPLGIGETFELDFSGTTAFCSFTAYNAKSDIKVTMTLWQGNRQIRTWAKDAVRLVSMHEQCAVSKGQTYTLKVSYSFDGKAQPSQSITKTNN